jgi:Ni,Fe-hydrogenase III large subunit/Ni,Fe-hydrogenase III component G
MFESDQLLKGLAKAPRAAEHRPWPRFIVGADQWRQLRDRLSTAAWAVLGIWGDAADDETAVHLALRDETPDGDDAIAVFSLACADRRFPSLASVRPGAARLERAIRDLFGLLPDGAEDLRPWLDHGVWPVRHPLRVSPPQPSPTSPTDPVNRSIVPEAAYAFLSVVEEGEEGAPSVHQIPVGPVHAGIIEPGHFRFHANGELVVRLEQRLGYAHKGTEGLMVGRGVADAARLAARISGDSTVAHGIAFARAVEAATDISPPPRAHWLRAVMAELERIANHCFDIGAICNDATFPLMLAEMTVLRERVVRAAGDCFGHRLMMDRVVPGGVAIDLTADGRGRLRHLLGEIGPRFRHLMRVYHGKPSLLDRTVGTGVTRAALVHRFAAGGFVGRAAGRGRDARRSPGYPPYDEMEFTVPVMADGDVHARLLIRAQEVEASLALLDQLLERLPDGPVADEVPTRGGEGIALVESFRGEILTWVRVGEDGRIERCHVRDPSWFQWPLLEAAIEGNIVADFPLCNKSFNCSYSGHDL